MNSRWQKALVPGVLGGLYASARAGHFGESPKIVLKNEKPLGDEFLGVSKTNYVLFTHVSYWFGNFNYRMPMKQYHHLRIRPVQVYLDGKLVK